MATEQSTQQLVREALDETRQLIAQLDICCFDCERAYYAPGWVEAVVDNDTWRKLSPDGQGHGLLCIGCMAIRAARLGLSDVEVKLTAGPFVCALTE